MGLLTEGSPLSWEETKSYADHVRQHGVIQFLKQYNKLKERTKDCLYWGDEVEYMLVKFDHQNKKAVLLLDGSDVLKKLQRRQTEHPEDQLTTWHPEYAAYMVEGTPGKPYGGMMVHFNLVESNMRQRRKEIQAALGSDAIPMTLTSFPRTGCPSFTFPVCVPTPNEGFSHSLFYPDSVIYPDHPRFRTLSRNIRERRGEKVAINIPIYKDINTKSPFTEDFSVLGDDGEAQRAALPDHIYMDCMGFGMGCCCLQMTFQACNITEARNLYDQLTPLCPIMLALSAASPIYRGYLADLDTRWRVISQSVDDRTREERGLEPLKKDKFVINKSRYDSVDSYLSASICSDIKLVYDKDIYHQLREGGVDDLLAKHIAHLFIRDPISLFTEKINQNDDEDTDHFEVWNGTEQVQKLTKEKLTADFIPWQNIQSTNWQTMRFKPPPPKSKIGWRVEFRPMEVQLTDFENAAYTVFLVLLTRVILTFQLNFLIPLSKVDENLATAFKRDAIREGKFFFRKDILTDCSPPEASKCVSSCLPGERLCCGKDMYIQMTINEIVNGKEDFPGLVPLIYKYMDNAEFDVDTRCTITQYLTLISRRAAGTLKTTARWIRDFVQNHPDYKKDSVVSETVNYDLLVQCAKISNGEIKCPDLVPVTSSKTSNDIPEAVSKINNSKSKNLQNSHLQNSH